MFQETVQISSLSILDLKESLGIVNHRRPYPGILRGSPNYPEFSCFYRIKSAVFVVVQTFPYYPSPHVYFVGGSGQYRVESVTSSPETRPASSSGQSTLVQYSQYTCIVLSVHLYSTVSTLVQYTEYTCTVHKTGFYFSGHEDGKVKLWLSQRNALSLLTCLDTSRYFTTDDFR